MNEKTETFTELYNGEYEIPAHCEANPGHNSIVEYEPTYWHNDVFYSFSETNKLAKDCPSVTIGIPVDVLGIEEADTAVADYFLRQIKPYFDALNDELYNRSRPVTENGWYYFCEPGGEVLPRNGSFFTIRMTKDYENGSGVTVYPYVGKEIPSKLYLCILIQVQLPYHKLKKSVKMLTSDLPKAIDSFIAGTDRVSLAKVLDLSKRQQAIRAAIRDSEYCAFIANGSMLPRSKGTDLPMVKGVPFKSPEVDEIEICGVLGMGIKRGVTVITGGGYSGKSTLIDAISAGIYDHCLGDGRELCITDDTAVTISAEDGRSIRHVNISPFIQGIPSADATDFSTDRASGSTSQAANIMEAVDNGARLLLIDEDRSATNFMIRDRMMRELIKNEPIIPFTERVKELAEHGVSTILVIGGSGEYLSVADKIYMMEGFEPIDVTDKSKEICVRNGSMQHNVPSADWSQARHFLSKGFDSHPNGFGSERLSVLDLGVMMIGAEDIDLRGLHDIVTPRQLHALGFMLRSLMAENHVNSITRGQVTFNLAKMIDSLYEKITSEGIDTVYSSGFTTVQRFFDMPRKAELWSVINRLRRVTVESGK